MRTKLLLLPLLLIIVFCSCKKTVMIDLPEESNKPVLNLLMGKDSLIIARVTISERITGHSIFPEAAVSVIKLYENGQFKENLSPFSNGYGTYYKSTVRARSGVNYRIVATVPEYGDVEGSDFIPEPVSGGEMSIKLVSNNDVYGFRKANISVELHDKPGEKNYYRIRLYELAEFKDDAGNEHPYRTGIPFITGDLQDGIFNKGGHMEFYTDDALFDGRSPRLNFISDRTGKFNKVIVEVTSLTYSSYSYLFSSFMARMKNEDPLSEKVIVYSNIINGLGIVGGMALQEYIITPQ
ncbi:DUF4249 domain-containing protein [Chitinophaga flava]|uniref:DUF4249 domain-containing protein n=1 Tax=Chitinophaga flava TaxID=2259036 RepID=A0A365XUM7_9BACT|nr:DUF4249 domain-containing protein [Chitinophaga flava]RBL89731.1 DUF4249 domain-containing protein [Chitinophaga flava]